MTPRQDPYRVLGLVPGATAGEIRSAYRRLAKLNHPDTAGERSLPRFLAIKAAYEDLVDGEGRLRGRDWPGRNGGAGAGRPSGAQANRASREAWRARRAGGSASAGGPGAASAGANGNGAGPANRGKAGPDGGRAHAGPKRGSGTRADQGPRSGPSPRSGGRPKSADRRTARPGSTTYDEAAQPLDPSWEGGSWYGASSGSYWTLNPREYADPRKHGPEYQERAKRAAQLEAARRAGARPTEDGPADGPQPATDSAPQPPPPPWRPAPAAASTPSSSRDSNPGTPPRAHRRPVRRPAGPGAP